MSRDKDIQQVRDLCMEMIGDDSTYPQVYLEQIARRDYAFFADFEDDVLNYMGSEWIAELAEENITITDLCGVIREEAQKYWDEWDDMSPEEQKELIDIDEIDWFRSMSSQSR